MPPYASFGSVFESYISYSNQTATTTTTSTTPSKQADTADYKVKNALDGAVFSLQAVIDFLSKNGVAKASVRELQKGLHIADEYVNLLERAQEYAECVAVSGQVSVAMVCLFISSWESLGRYQAAVYKQAYKQFHSSREGGRSMLSATETDKALARQVTMAEQCCASQKGLILAEMWGERVLRITSSSSTSRQ